MKYNGQLAAIPQNSFKIEYVIKNGEVKMLNQYLIIGDTKVHLIYNGNRDQTQVIMNGTHKIEKGLLLVVVRTNKGNLQHSIMDMRRVV